MNKQDGRGMEHTCILHVQSGFELLTVRIQSQSDMTNINREGCSFHPPAGFFLKLHQCSSNGIKNKLLITRIPTIIPIVQRFDFMYFNGFI